MRISDWSSDVCSSDRRTGLVRTVAVQHDPFAVLAAEGEALDVRDHRFAPAGHLHQHGSVARLPSGSLRFLLALLADGLVQIAIALTLHLPGRGTIRLGRFFGSPDEGHPLPVSSAKVRIG